jgi:hypothetical protein
MIWRGRSDETASNDSNVYDAVRFCMAEINCYTFCAASENFPMLNSIEVTAGHGQRRGHVRNDNPA